MAKRKGTVLACKECGMEVKVEKDCGCEPCEISCCGATMQPKKAKGAKSKG